jgi:hypothetical protein
MFTHLHKSSVKNLGFGKIYFANAKKEVFMSSIPPISRGFSLAYEYKTEVGSTLLYIAGAVVACVQAYKLYHACKCTLFPQGYELKDKILQKAQLKVELYNLYHAVSKLKKNDPGQIVEDKIVQCEKLLQKQTEANDTEIEALLLDILKMLISKQIQGTPAILLRFVPYLSLDQCKDIATFCWQISDGQEKTEDSRLTETPEFLQIIDHVWDKYFPHGPTLKDSAYLLFFTEAYLKSSSREKKEGRIQLCVDRITKSDSQVPSIDLNTTSLASIWLKLFTLPLPNKDTWQQQHLQKAADSIHAVFKADLTRFQNGHSIQEQLVFFRSLIEFSIDNPNQDQLLQACKQYLTEDFVNDLISKIEKKTSPSSENHLNAYIHLLESCCLMKKLSFPPLNHEDLVSNIYSKSLEIISSKSSTTNHFYDRCRLFQALGDFHLENHKEDVKALMHDFESLPSHDEQHKALMEMEPYLHHLLQHDEKLNKLIEKTNSWVSLSNKINAFLLLAQTAPQGEKKKLIQEAYSLWKQQVEDVNNPSYADFFGLAFNKLHLNTQLELWEIVFDATSKDSLRLSFVNRLKEQERLLRQLPKEGLADATARLALEYAKTGLADNEAHNILKDFKIIQAMGQVCTPLITLVALPLIVYGIRKVAPFGLNAVSCLC